MLKDKDKKLLAAIILSSLVTLSTVVLASNGWFTFIPTLDLTTPGLKLDSPFILSSLPDYFQISVTMSGSKTTEMPHQVEINIEHNRVEEGPWGATASYVLALKETDGTLVEEIDSGSFTHLREFESYEKPLTWTPEANPSGYQVVLDLTDVTWEIVYTIRARVMSPGGIMESGGITVSDGLEHYFTVLPGESPSFTITPDPLYEIGGLWVDTYIQPVPGSPLVYIFDPVNDDHMIDASFETIP